MASKSMPNAALPAAMSAFMPISSAPPPRADVVQRARLGLLMLTVVGPLALLDGGTCSTCSGGRVPTSVRSYVGERRPERIRFWFPQSTDIRRRLMIIHDRTAPTAAESDCSTVFLAIELSRSSWWVAVHTPPVDKIGLYKLAAGDVAGLARWL